MTYEFAQLIPTACWSLERTYEHRTYATLRIITDACCRVPESRQHLSRYRARGKSACGYLLLSGETVVGQGAQYVGECTVTQAEYQGVLLALDQASAFCRRDIEVWMDNEVVVGQLSGHYALRSELIKPLFDKVKQLELRYSRVSYFHHSRGSLWARAADKLANAEYSRLHTG
jgi:ribonuclease HI